MLFHVTVEWSCHVARIGIIPVASHGCNWKAWWECGYTANSWLNKNNFKRLNLLLEIRYITKKRLTHTQKRSRKKHKFAFLLVLTISGVELTIIVVIFIFTFSFCSLYELGTHLACSCLKALTINATMQLSLITLAR